MLKGWVKDGTGYFRISCDLGTRVKRGELRLFRIAKKGQG